MIARSIYILAPRLTRDHEISRMRIYVRVILIAMTSCFALVLIFNTDVGSKVASLVMISWGLICLAFFVRGNMTVPRITIPLVGFIILSTLIARGYGLHSVTVPALMLVIVFSALLASRWAPLIYLGLSMMALALVYFGEQQL